MYIYYVYAYIYIYIYIVLKLHCIYMRQCTFYDFDFPSEKYSPWCIMSPRRKVRNTFHIRQTNCYPGSIFGTNCIKRIISLNAPLPCPAHWLLGIRRSLGTGQAIKWVHFTPGKDNAIQINNLD